MKRPMTMHLDDNRMELIMGRLLQIGVLAAGALMVDSVDVAVSQTKPRPVGSAAVI